MVMNYMKYAGQKKVEIIFLKMVLIPRFFQPEPEGDLSSLPEEAPEQRVKIKMMLNFTGYDNMIDNFSLKQLI